MVRLLVYGSSIFLAGVSAQLEAMHEVQVTTCQTLSDVGSLSALDAVVIDLNDLTSLDTLRLLRVRPDLRLIGLNATTNALTVMSGEVYFTPTITDIIARLGRQVT